jgi:enoyl-CoA hydratase/carnithine racemase
MSEGELIVERRGPVGWIVFNRPESANALNAGMFAQLPSAWRELDADPGVGAIVVTGRGAAFQTGLDMVALARDPDRRSGSVRSSPTATGSRSWQ